MIVALALLQFAISQAPTTSGGGVVDPRAGAPTDSAVGAVGAVGTVDPAGTVAVSALPTDDELRLLAERDLTQARAPLRRAARTADVAGTRALALRLLATHDASVATARICARSLRLDDDAGVRRAAAECLGRLGPRLAGPHTSALIASLDDGSLDVLTMSGWALANAGDASAIGALTARATHEDPRVAKLFFSYAERLRDRLGLRYDGVGPSTDAPRPSADDPTAVPPGVVLSFPALSVDAAAATGWLGLYGAMLGWFHGPLLLSAHGGQAGAEAGALAGLGLSALGAAALSGYGFSRADSLPLAHTVVQFGTFGGMAGYGAGQLSAVGPASGVSSANLSLLGSVVGIGMGMAFVETSPPSVGALAAGVTAGATVGIAGGTLAASYKYPFNQSLGVMLLSGSVAGAATTAMLAEQDIGLFPVAGAAAGSALGGGVAAIVASSVEPSAADATENSGWLILSGMAAGAALGGVGGWLLPTEYDPLLESTLKLNPPTVAVLPGAGVRPEAVAAVMLTGTF
jgi:hypothetical protein